MRFIRLVVKVKYINYMLAVSIKYFPEEGSEENSNMKHIVLFIMCFMLLFSFDHDEQ